MPVEKPQDVMQLDREIREGFERVTVVARREQARIDNFADVMEVRAQTIRTAEIWNTNLDRSGVVTTVETFPGAPGAVDIEIRIHRPEAPVANAPCMFFVHGGGMVAGVAEMDDARLIGMVRDTKCVATSIEYRLAPEYPAPAGAEDCVMGLEYVCAHAKRLGIDEARIAIGGVSGGGGVAAAAAQMARDKNIPLCLQWLIYPQLDDRHMTVSSQADWPGWTKELNQGAWKAVLGQRYGAPEVSGYEAPARAQDLSGLAPAYIEVAAMEIFRDECIDYASRLLVADVPTELHVFPGCCHGFDLFAPDAELTRVALLTRNSALRRAWNLPRK